VAIVRPARACAALLLVGLAMFVVAGCGGGTQVDYTKVAETVRASLESKREGFGVKVESVDCPSGVDVEPGTHFECTVRFPGEKVRYARLRIRDADADLSLESLSPRPFGP
jgi:hypothetical protein